MWNYSDKVMDHFLHPRNVGQIDRPDGVGEVGSLACGDALKLMFKLDEHGRIQDARFQTFGCASAIASSSALTEIIKGKTLDEALKITNGDIAEYLGGLPEEKMHCSVMGREALEAAIASYRGEGPGRKEIHGDIVCKCFGVTDREIERAIRENNLLTVDQVTHYTKAGGGCGGCKEQIQDILDRLVQARVAEKTAPRPPKGKMSNIRKIQLIQETIAREVQPALQRDGGDVELIDVVGDRVLVALRGTCSNCPASSVTVHDFIQGKLREFVADEIVVEEAEE